jgi:hypothetical protein
MVRKIIQGKIREIGCETGWEMVREMRMYQKRRDTNGENGFR